MAKAYVALVGRPNTGKSTLFNKLAGSRISIVGDTPGVTRDRIITESVWCDSSFYVIDTGGIEPENQDIILKQMRRQAQIAMDMADVIIYVADAKAGVTSADAEICAMIRKTSKKCILAVNKIDDYSAAHKTYDFYELGLGEPFPISAEHGLGVGELLDEVVKNFPEEKQNVAEDDALKIVVVGKPNAGKSSLINTLLGQERVIVSSIAGTTRDAIDTPFEYENEKYILIDTAGIRRKSKSLTDIDFYSAVRAQRAIERADVCVFMIDATLGVSEQDVKIAGMLRESGKALIIVMNKWDLVEKETNTMAHMARVVKNKLFFVDYAPVLFMCATDGSRSAALMPAIKSAAEQYKRRITTGLLNDVIGDAVSMNSPPGKSGRFLNIYYASQPVIMPPTFILFVNDATLENIQYTKYLEGKIRGAFGFEGTPIRFIYRNKNKDKQ